MLIGRAIADPARFIGDAWVVDHGDLPRAGVLGWLLGPLGAILAIPLTLLGKTLLVDIDPLAGWADALLRSTPKEPSPGAAGQHPPPVTGGTSEWGAAAPT